MDLNGKFALVTGASRGIGTAMAKELAARGARVIVTARSQRALAALTDEITAAGGTASSIAADLSERAGVLALREEVAKVTDRLDVMIVNAAFAPARIRVQEIDPVELETAMKVNVLATQALIAAFHPLLEVSGDGRLIGMTSAAALAAYPGFAAYGASKAAFDMILHTYAVDNAASSVRTALVAPGPTRTAMRADGFPNEDPMTLKTPEFVAGAVIDLIERDFTNDTYLDVHEAFVAL